MSFNPVVGQIQHPTRNRPSAPEVTVELGGLTRVPPSMPFIRALRTKCFSLTPSAEGYFILMYFWMAWDEAPLRESRALSASRTMTMVGGCLRSLAASAER